MTIYCAKCEAANSDKAPFCGECGHTLTSLAPKVQTADPVDSPPDDHTSDAEPGDAPRPTSPSASQFALQIYELLHACVALWAIALCGIGCVPLFSGGEEPFLAPYLPAGLMVLLFYAFRDYYHRWEKLARQQRRE